jgi:hypothetical protein
MNCPPARIAPATIAWSATNIGAYSEPAFPDHAFCIEFVILNGEHHVYRVNRENLKQLFANISEVLDKSPTAERESVALPLPPILASANVDLGS